MRGKSNASIVSEHNWIVGTVIANVRIYRVPDSQKIRCNCDVNLFAFVNSADLLDRSYKNCRINTANYAQKLDCLINIDVGILTLIDSQVRECTRFVVLRHHTF
jgi:hypothetical protein